MHDSALARDARELRLALSGVPREFWHLEVKDIGLAAIKAWGGRKVSPVEQRFWCKTLLKQPSRQKCIIGSLDEGAGLALATVLATQLGYNKKSQEYEHTYRILNLDAQHLPYKKEPGSEIAAVVIHNVLADSPSERIMLVRDMMLKFPRALRFLVVEGTRDPWGWCMNNLVLRPDVCCLATKIL